MSFLHPKNIPASSVIIPDDRAEAQALVQEGIASQEQTVKISAAQQTWFARTVKPMLDELALRREQNGFGQEFELSIMPRDRG